MNFLGHLYLSGISDEIAIGHFIGDFVKGNQYEDYEGHIREGILLHREIDDYTDHHPVLKKCRKLLWNQFRHYSGVIIDVYCDHFLACDWDKYSSISLETYAEEKYAMLEKNQDKLPAQARYLLSYMKRDNWLVNYQNFDGLNRTFIGMSKRTSFRSHMEHSVEALKENYELYRKGFEDFFPDIVNEMARRNPALKPI